MVVELKAVTELADEHRAQVLNYLKAGGFELGVLVNFGHYPNCNMSASQRHDQNRNPMRRSPSKPLAFFGVFSG
jgi:hypothetical protein